MNKLLVSIFAIVLIIVLGELTYLLYANGKINRVPASQPTEVKTEDTLVRSPNHAIDLNSLSMLTYWQRGVVNSAKITVELKGTIIKIDTDGEIQEHGWPTFKYALKIRIRGENGDENDIFLNQNELQKTSFKYTTGDKTENIDYKELKISDNIQAFLIFDMKKDFENNFISGEIIKL